MIGHHKFLYINYIIGFAIILLTNFTILSTVFDEWNSNGPYSHGFLGFAVVLYVLWLQRNYFFNVRHAPSLIASCLLLISCLGLLVAHLASVQQLQQLMLFVVIIFYTVSIYGFTVLKKLFFPILMLGLILPFWSLLQTPLREFSTIAGEIGPRLVGIDVLRENYRLSTYGGKFDVEEACSGLGFFMVAALFAACVSFFNKLGVKQSLKFLLISLCFSLLANWLRIIIIIIVGSYTHMQHFVVQDHLTFGWGVFSVFLVPLIYISNRYFSLKQRGEIDSEKLTPHESTINKPHLLSTYLILLSFICAQYWIPSRFDEGYRFKLPVLGEYELVSEDKISSPNWFPISHGVSSESFNFFVKGELGIQLYVANYVKQTQAHEIIYVGNRLFDKKRWSVTGKKLIQLSNTEINSIALYRGGERVRLIFYWYVVNGRFLTDKKITKLEEVKAAIAGTPGASLIAFSMDYRQADELESMQKMQDFAQTFFNNSQP